VTLAAAALAVACGGDTTEPDPRVEGPKALPTLVLYDDTSTPAWTAELHALSAGQLTSHFGPWVARPVSGYRAGDLALHRAAIYLGSDVHAAVPEAFLDDVLAGARPVMWLLGNVDRLVARTEGFAERFGFLPGPQETLATVAVEYKGERLSRNEWDGSARRGATIVDPARAQVLAKGLRGDGSSFAWAVRSGDLFYLSEIPFTFPDEAGRYLALADLLFDLLAPTTQERHRALVRIEDVTPMMPADKLRALADVLHANGAPFTVAVVPVFEDPLGSYFEDGVPLTVRLRDAPEVVEALRYMVSRGGTLLLHGYTHQYGTKRNPYDGMSGNDYEFWLAHEDETGAVRMDGPTPEAPGTWAAGRVRLGLEEMAAAGLPAPGMFEYPHYAGSPADSRAIAAILPIAYHRGLYFPGTFAGEEDLTRPFEQIVPYPVQDVYGFTLVPENIAFYDPWTPPPRQRLAAELVANARANRVVRDGLASFFFHPWFEVGVLEQIVRGIQAEGYVFVAPEEVVEGAGGR
jgi:uncharacterized protein YdaL